MSVTVEARAKINLLLKVGQKRPDGYHNIESVMQSVKLSDIIEIKQTGHSILIECDDPTIPSGVNNLAYKAAEMFQRFTGIDLSISINIKKHIPVAAGLAGGSADAAGVLVGLNALYGVGLSHENLEMLASKCGSDVPFCIRGGTVIAYGRGEQLCHYCPLPEYTVIIVKPSFSVSTMVAYNGISEYSVLDMRDSKEMISLLQKGELERASALSINDLEKVVSNQYGEIIDIKKALLKAGAKLATMSGSGSSVFGMFCQSCNEEDLIRLCKKELPGVSIDKIQLTHTAGEGVIIR